MPAFETRRKPDRDGLAHGNGLSRAVEAVKVPETMALARVIHGLQAAWNVGQSLRSIQES